MSKKRKGPENQALDACGFGAGNETRKRKRGLECISGGPQGPESVGQGVPGPPKHHGDLAENLAAVWVDVSSKRLPAPPSVQFQPSRSHRIVVAGVPPPVSLYVTSLPLMANAAPAVGDAAISVTKHRPVA